MRRSYKKNPFLEKKFVSINLTKLFDATITVLIILYHLSKIFHLSFSYLLKQKHKNVTHAIYLRLITCFVWYLSDILGLHQHLKEMIQNESLPSILEFIRRCVLWADAETFMKASVYCSNLWPYGIFAVHTISQLLTPKKP